ncbi:hypothetical protein C8R44DRAFT_984104 [Mycena epipterygia]|nr:hypothetical protein C8R44DRAFT_984104 [Mycena epipterygia]
MRLYHTQPQRYMLHPTSLSVVPRPPSHPSHAQRITTKTGFLPILSEHGPPVVPEAPRRHRRIHATRLFARVWRRPLACRRHDNHDLDLHAVDGVHVVPALHRPPYATLCPPYSAMPHTTPHTALDATATTMTTECVLPAVLVSPLVRYARNPASKRFFSSRNLSDV